MKTQDYIRAKSEGYSLGFMDGRRDTRKTFLGLLEENLSALRELEREENDSFLTTAIEAYEELKTQMRLRG